MAEVSRARRSTPVMMNGGSRGPVDASVDERDVRIAEAGIDGVVTLASAFAAWAKTMLFPV